MGVGEGDRVAVRTVAVTPQGMRVYGNDFPLHEGSGLFGGYAEYMEFVPGSAVHRLRDDLPAAELTVFESLCNAVTWVHPVNPGDVLVVEGPGHMGLASVVAAKARGADTIIVTGLSRDRLRLDTALRVGADHVIDVEKENAVERVAEITGGRMADVVLDAASGNPVTFRNAIDLVRPSGTVVAAGFKDCPVEGFDVSWIPRRNLKILLRRRTRPRRSVRADQRRPRRDRGSARRGVPARAVRRGARVARPPAAGRDAVRVSLQIS